MLANKKFQLSLPHDLWEILNAARRKAELTWAQWGKRAAEHYLATGFSGSGGSERVKELQEGYDKQVAYAAALKGKLARSERRCETLQELARGMEVLLEQRIAEQPQLGGLSFLTLGEELMKMMRKIEDIRKHGEPYIDREIRELIQRAGGEMPAEIVWNEKQQRYVQQVEEVPDFDLSEPPAPEPAAGSGDELQPASTG